MDLFEQLIEYKKEGIPCMMVTVVEKKGECPSTVGKKMLVNVDGKAIGTVGGGAIEHYAINKCKELIPKQQNFLEKYVLKEGEVIKDMTTLDMECGGKVTLYYDYIGSKAVVYIFGAGHVGQAVAHLLKTIRYHITVIDSRSELISKFCDADRKINSGFTAFVEKEGIKENSYVVVCTPSHKNDFNVISKILQMECNPKYMGMLCSKAKLKTFLSKTAIDLKRDCNVENFYSPIGLDIGGESPEEIAISIASEIVAVFYHKNGHKHMRDSN